MIRIKKKLKRNPHVATYGYHATNSNHLKSIMTNGFKTKLLKQKENYERWLYNQILYKGRSPIYFLTVPNFSKISEELKYMFDESEVDVILKVNVDKFDQLPDLYLLLDREEFRLGNFENIEDAHIYAPILNDNPLKEFFDRRKLKIKNFLNEDLATETIFLTESFCIAENIPSKYIEDVIYL